MQGENRHIECYRAVQFALKEFNFKPYDAEA